VPEVASLARRNHDRSAEASEVAAINVSRLFIEEAQMIGRVSGRVKNPKPCVARLNDFAFAPESDHLG
jgi:hypothetical protein